MIELVFNESAVEEATLVWLESQGGAVKNGPEIAPGELFAERQDYGQVALGKPWRDTMLPKLISGEPRVKDAEHFFEVVL